LVGFPIAFFIRQPTTTEIYFYGSVCENERREPEVGGGWKAIMEICFYAYDFFYDGWINLQKRRASEGRRERTKRTKSERRSHLYYTNRIIE